MYQYEFSEENSKIFNNLQLHLHTVKCLNSTLTLTPFLHFNGYTYSFKMQQDKGIKIWDLRNIFLILGSRFLESYLQNIALNTSFKLINSVNFLWQKFVPGNENLFLALGFPESF
jgi:hypothetical protein